MILHYKVICWGQPELIVNRSSNKFRALPLSYGCPHPLYATLPFCPMLATDSFPRYRHTHAVCHRYLMQIAKGMKSTKCTCSSLYNFLIYIPRTSHSLIALWPYCIISASTKTFTGLIICNKEMVER